MKKLNLKIKGLDTPEVLSREQLKKVMSAMGGASTNNGYTCCFVGASACPPYASKCSTYCTCTW